MFMQISWSELARSLSLSFRLKLCKSINEEVEEFHEKPSQGQTALWLKTIFHCFISAWLDVKLSSIEVFWSNETLN